MKIKDYIEGKVTNKNLKFKWKIDKIKNHHNGFSYIPYYIVPELRDDTSNFINDMTEKYGSIGSENYKNSVECQKMKELGQYIREVHDSIGLTKDLENKEFSSLKSMQEWFDKNGFDVNAENVYSNE